MVWILLMACWSPEQLCAGKGPVSMELGHGEGAEFEAFTADTENEIITPPQGGYGLTFRARTWGLVTNNVLSLDMSTLVDGESIGDFQVDDLLLYCQSDDGSGLLFGTATPIDEALFPQAEDLEALVGKQAVMRVQATDVQGDTATAEATVTLALRP